MVTKSKKILRLWLWWALQQQQQLRRPLELPPPEKEGFQYSRENSRESLLDWRYLSKWNMKEVVPRGFLAVYVGPELRRFVIPTNYLSMPEFRALMEIMAEEFGFHQEGGLQIPCEEKYFEEILDKCSCQMKTKNKNKTKTKNNNN